MKHWRLSSYQHARQEQMYLKLYRQEALQDQGGRCYYCKDRLTPRTATADHKRPRVRYGQNSKDNIVAACRPCNLTKGEMSEGQYFNRITKRPDGSTPFHIMLAWMRRKLNIQTLRAEKRMNRLFAMAEE